MKMNLEIFQGLTAQKALGAPGRRLPFPNDKSAPDTLSPTLWLWSLALIGDNPFN